jgi:hypothetical protein
VLGWTDRTAVRASANALCIAVPDEGLSGAPLHNRTGATVVSYEYVAHVPFEATDDTEANRLKTWWDQVLGQTVHPVQSNIYKGGVEVQP